MFGVDEAMIVYEFVLAWGKVGFGRGEFHGPTGVAVDLQGNVYVADTANARVLLFDGNGKPLSGLGCPNAVNFTCPGGSGQGQFDNPWGVAVDSSGYVYVTDSVNNRVQKFDVNGNFVSAWGCPNAATQRCPWGWGPGQFGDPLGIAVDSAGNMYVADRANYRVQKIDQNTGSITQWGGSYGSGADQFGGAGPGGIAVDPSGKYVYVTDPSNNRVKKYSNSGQLLSALGCPNALNQACNPGSGPGQLNNPIGVTVDSSGNVYVADSGNNRIQKFDSAENPLTQWGSYGSGPGQFNYPEGVAVDSSGNVYVNDLQNNRVQKFKPITRKVPFTIIPAEKVMRVVQGQSSTMTITVSLISGTPDPVQLSVTGLPNGATATLSSNPVTPTATTTLKISASYNTQAGQYYTLTISGTSGGITETATISLWVD